MKLDYSVSELIAIGMGLGCPFWIGSAVEPGELPQHPPPWFGCERETAREARGLSNFDVTSYLARPSRGITIT